MKFWRKPLDYDKCTTPKGDIYIIDDRCKGCGFCIEFCPTDVLVEADRSNTKGYHPPEIKYPEKCIACRLCELICPDFAIYVVIPEGSTGDSSEKSNEPTTGKNDLEVMENA